MLSNKKVIFYELNEVPFRIIDWFVSSRPKSTLAALLKGGRSYRTQTEDVGHLSPWITWPTLHRGVTNQLHEIADFGQNLEHTNREYPSIWSLLAEGGRKVGLFGSLHSYPLPANVRDYAFYVPDTFAAGPECFPAEFEVFQRFNLAMVDRSGRNVERGVALRPALQFLKAAPGLGLRARTVADLGRQLTSERFKKQRVVRRRTSQVQIAFDFFLKALRRERPDIAFFFTNHVASSMHRYWPALFPTDYASSDWSKTWVETYAGEIPYAMEKADQQLRDLWNFVQAHNEYVLILASSMGQAAVDGRKVVHHELNIGDIPRFMRALGITSEEWRRERAMIPLYTFVLAEAAIGRFRAGVASLTVNGIPIVVREPGNGVFSIGFGQANLDESSAEVRLNGETVSFRDLGLVNQPIQDEAGANAYHIPEGSLIVFDPTEASAGQGSRSSVSTVEIAPSLLRNFGVKIPSYMTSPVSL